MNMLSGLFMEHLPPWHNETGNPHPANERPYAMVRENLIIVPGKYRVSFRITTRTEVGK
jgi:hypothetical protein